MEFRHFVSWTRLHFLCFLRVIPKQPFVSPGIQIISRDPGLMLLDLDMLAEKLAQEIIDGN